MKAAERLASLLVVMLFSCGCATTVKLTDRLPKDSPKGYAEFYVTGNLGLLFPIYQIEGPKERSVGDADEYTRRRVACSPGTNIFFIKPGSWGTRANKRVDVDVKDGMVTPVNILARKISYTTYSLEVNVENPQTLEQHETRMRKRNPAIASGTTPAHPSSISITAQYPIGGTSFSVAGGDTRQVFEAQELLNRAAKGLDLTKEADKAEFTNRYKQERKNHPELQNLIITCPAIKGL